MAFGGEVDRHKAVHGKASDIIHDGRTLFRGLEMPLSVQRYHSLVVRSPLPNGLEPSAYILEDGQEILMAIRHKRLPVEGVQFHPESFYTPDGKMLLQNFLERTK
jgi:para-aminobenzoate synthetase component 2